MNKIFTLFCSLFLLVSSLQAQSKLDYENDSRWFWGLNVGTTWQTTDIQNRNDWGLGFVLGKSFNYNYGKLISFDIRGRYLYGNWYGMDTDSTQAGNLPSVLRSGATNYYDSLGFSYLNYRSTGHRLGLELVLHANRFRERTGWDPYIFGGIGLTWFDTKGNYLNDADTLGNDGMYAFDPTANYSKIDMKGLLDDTYETNLDGPGFKVGFMPSLGFGLGYQIGPRFSVGLEHKTTFTRVDDYDAYLSGKGSYKADLYHYTSFYLRFQVKNRKPMVVDNSLEKLPEYTEQQVVQGTPRPPLVDFTNPSASGTTVTVPTYTIRGNVRFVDNVSGVTFRQNGNYVGNFVFNPQTDRFESTVTLVPGQNVFELVGINTDGTDAETTVIVYQREVPTPPVVTITNPATSPATVTNANFAFQGSVLNVQSQNQVSLTVNGQTTTNFQFNPSNGVVTAPLLLTVGTNIVTLTGTNNAGTDSESTTLIYRPQQTEQPPIVYFVDPHVNPYTTNQGTFLINAEIVHVAGRQNVVFKQNGTVNQNFTYNASTDDFQSNVVLVPGQNVFEIIGSNSAGTAQATTIIIYERQAPRPPVVTITNPATNPYATDQAVFVLGATVLNVSQANQVQVQLNGQTLTNFTFAAQSGSVTAVLNLNEGSNTVLVRGTNNDGTDFKQTVIVYRKPVQQQPPIVTFISPNVNPFTTTVTSHMVNATVLNVDQANGINVNVNGANYSNFTFNEVTKQVTFPLNLIEGSNVIVITGTNAVGTDSKNQTIIYRKPLTLTPPVVTFLDPINNPQTVYAQTYDVKVRVENVAGSQSIVLKINGVVSTNFAYSASSQWMTFTTGLLIGANILEVQATNAAGQDMETTTIIYRRPDPMNPPVVTITTPAANPHASATSSTPIQATVLNVDDAGDITVRVNNQVFTGFNYDHATKQLYFAMNLNAGNNTLEITAVNAAGQASDSRVINFKREAQAPAPFVTFIQPANPGTTVTSPSYTMLARITNVSSISQVQVEMNGQLVSQSMYSFNPITREVSFHTSLNPGNNTFVVTGTNSGGTHAASTNVLYRQPVAPCNKPVITFLQPTGGTSEVSDASFTFQATVTQITQVTQVKVKLNGVLQSGATFDAATNKLSGIVTLTDGQNILELVASNACGDGKANRTLIFRKPAAPCNAPTVSITVPRTTNLTVDAASYELKASVLNVASKSEITFLVNGVAAPFFFDPTTQLITATLGLTEGANTIQIQVSNACGSGQATTTITRTACKMPTLTLVQASAPHKGTITGEAFTLTVAVTEISQNSQISVKQNGTSINFVYQPQSNTISIDRTLVVGNNKFEITVTNACGTATYKHDVIRKQDPNAVPPTVNIINPASSPFQTTQGAMQVKIATQFVSSASQIGVTINGVATNFDFNPTTNTVTFNRTWVEGANVIMATVVTPYGTDSDTKTVIYTQQQTVSPPQIFVTNPVTCPATLPVGTTNVTGYVTNITNLNQVTIKLNGRPTGNINPVLNNGQLTFSIPVSFGAGSNPITLQIDANNGNGTDSKTCVLSVQQTSTTNGSGSSTGTIQVGKTPVGGAGQGGRGTTGTDSVPARKPGTVKPNPTPAPSIPSSGSAPARKPGSVPPRGK